MPRRFQRSEHDTGYMLEPSKAWTILTPGVGWGESKEWSFADLKEKALISFQGRPIVADRNV